MTATTASWFSEEELPAVRDFWRVYDASYEAMQDSALEAVVDHPVFGPLIASIPEEQRLRQNGESRALFLRAIEGDWAAYEANLRSQGQTYAAMGVSFRDWYDIMRIVYRHLLPPMVSAYGQEPDRLVRALRAMQELLDRAMTVIGESYIHAKETALRESERLARENEARTAALEAEHLRIQEASRMKSEFLANMSHELRTPLNAIIGFAELLHDGEVGPVAAKQQEFLADILTSGRHLLKLINDVLDLSKVEAGRMEFYPEPVDLGSVVGEVTSILRTTAVRNNVRMQSEISPGVGIVSLDPGRLKQVLYNYLSNALKFTPADGVVTVRARPEGRDAIRLEVIDTGPGIAPDDQKRLFAEFQQLDGGSAKRHGGTGLGLALTKRLVEAQGGSVGLRSEPGKGSAFFAVFPRVLVHRTSQRTMPATSARPGAPRVLIIEDDPQDSAAIARALVESGYSVDFAPTGARAITMCRQRRYDAITLDLILPDMSGLDVLRSLRSEGKNGSSPVLVITIVAEQATAGFVVSDVLPKPLDPAQLVESLKRAGVDPDARATVLVVDDDAGSLKLMATALERHGHRPVCYDDAEKALDAVARERPKAIVLDLLMPGTDGFRFLARLRASPEHHDVPVLVWTMKELSPGELARLRATVHTVVQKGAGAGDLVSELNGCLARGGG